MKVDEKITVQEAAEIYRENHGKIVNTDKTSFVSLQNINKIYPNNVQAVYDFNLDIDKHDFVALVGPSGCGKSTTLRMIAGLEEISTGELYINQIYSNYLESKDRDIAMVFQSYALYPQLSVYDNIGFGLTIRKDNLPELDKEGNPILDENGNPITVVRHYKKSEIEDRVFRAAEILDLTKYLDRKPKELSGGQMQRVALGRAIVRNAQLFLMDEPLSNLDAKLRVQMRSEIVKIHENVGATTIYVTHDQTEAMTMANKIVVMNKGFIQQVGAPIDVYKKPKNRFVATFIGTPPMNIVKATYDGNNKKLYFANGLEINLTQEQIKKHDTFYISRIQLLNEYIDTILQNRDILEARKLYLSVTGFKKNDENEEVSTKKKSKLIKFIANIKEKSTRDAREQAEIDEMLENLNSMVEEYNSYLLNPHDIEVGIRPEHIYLKEQNKENCSSSFSLTTDIVEILGSEFVAYTNCELGKLTIKLQDPVKPHTMYDVVFNLDQIHLFDLVSTENIFY